MKKILLLLLMISSYSWADPRDNFTLKEAQDLSLLFKYDPFIVDYCDCCSYEGDYAVKVHLMKVISSEIVSCEWDPEFYSVKVKVEILAQIPYNENGLDYNSPIKITKRQEELIVNANYFWGFKELFFKNAPIVPLVPLDAILKYQDEVNYGDCRAITNFPDPRKINDKQYGTWYSNILNSFENYDSEEGY